MSFCFSGTEHFGSIVTRVIKPQSVSLYGRLMDDSVNAGYKHNMPNDIFHYLSFNISISIQLTILLCFTADGKRLATQNNICSHGKTYPTNAAAIDNNE